MGRHSRFPAVNRDSEQEAPEPQVAPNPEATEPQATPDSGVHELAGVPDFRVATVSEIMDWVGDDEGRRVTAFEAELEGRNRSTLISKLTES